MNINLWIESWEKSEMKKLLGIFTAVVALSGCACFGTDGGSSASSAQMFDTKEARDFVANAEDRVFFDYDRSTVDAEAAETLREQAAWLKDHANVNILVSGHCDERGTREYNLALGERRANSVKQFLIGQGIDSARIATVSFGKEKPAVMGDNEASYAQNRRSVTIIKK